LHSHLPQLGMEEVLVFYNSFLPVIAVPDQQDKISARGYAMGYLGGVILLIFNLIFVLFPGFFGITMILLHPGCFPHCFLMVDRFSQITFLRLPKYTFGKRV